MIRVTYIEKDGFIRHVDAVPGMSAMEAARGNGVNGIGGDCGGEAACATCHVIVDPLWRDRVGSPRTVAEQALLEEVSEVGLDGSRLACQIALSPVLDGLVLNLPHAQD